MTVMATTTLTPTLTIPIQGTAPAGACGHCLHGSGSDDTGCHPALAWPAAAPQFSGPAEQLARLLAALAHQPGFEAGTTGLVHALRVWPGEVDLQLTMGRRCGGAELADTAFQALRGLLPDTDIYVLNAC